MEELKVEQAKQEAQPVNTEKTVEEIRGATEGKVSYGKFKDAEALLTAYNALESEFTKRCQKIKELETALSAVDKATPPTQATESQTAPETDKEDILKDYLKEILGKKQKAIVLDGVGVGVKTSIERPKTFKEAGQLAKEIFIN